MEIYSILLRQHTQLQVQERFKNKYIALFFSRYPHFYYTPLFFECFCEVTDMASRFLPLLDLLYDVMVRQTYWANERAPKVSSELMVLLGLQ